MILLLIGTSYAGWAFFTHGVRDLDKQRQLLAARMNVEPWERLNHDRLLEQLAFLCDTSFHGRKTGSPDAERAANWIALQMDRAGLTMINGDWMQNFTFSFQGETLSGRNVIGEVKGSQHPDQYIVMSAHYDHLGFHQGELYPGADDNASGVIAMLEVARYLAQHPLEYSVLFVALDAEEIGLKGANFLVQSELITERTILLNLNLDMLGRNHQNEIFLCGSAHYPVFRQQLAEVVQRSPLKVLFGHDRDWPSIIWLDDWSRSSDHAAFFDANIPFLYLGVEDHEDYHRPTDTFERSQPEFFVQAAELSLQIVQAISQKSSSEP
ncbi:MAG: M28 family peptidase [Bacteroidota bacterium]